MLHIPNSYAADATNRFWDHYLQYLSDRGVKPTVARWYVIRAQHYIKVLSDKRLADHGPAEVTGYLKQQGRYAPVENWQFRQIVDALQKMFEMLDVPWLDQVDWRYWMGSFPLPESHPAIARDAPVEAPRKNHRSL